MRRSPREATVATCIRSLVAATLVVVTAGTAAAAGPCGPNSSIGDYYINEDGQRVWCSSGGAGGAIQSILSTIGSLYAFIDAVGGGKMMIVSLLVAAFGVLLTGSQRVRVKTYRNSRLISDEIQGGVEAISRSRFGHFFGNLLSS